MAGSSQGGRGHVKARCHVVNLMRRGLDDAAIRADLAATGKKPPRISQLQLATHQHLGEAVPAGPKDVDPNAPPGPEVPSDAAHAALQAAIDVDASVLPAVVDALSACRAAGGCSCVPPLAGNSW